MENIKKLKVKWKNIGRRKIMGRIKQNRENIKEKRKVYKKYKFCMPNSCFVKNFFDLAC